jgi:hypothetical protein
MSESFSGDAKKALPKIFPDAYANLEYVAFANMSWCTYNTARNKQVVDDAFATWLEHVSFPVLHTLAIGLINYTRQEIGVIVCLVTCLPALRTLYIQTNDTCVSHNQVKKITRMQALYTALSRRNIVLHTGPGCLTLYEDYLRHNKVPLLEKHTQHPHTSQDGAKSHILHLRPTKRLGNQ